MGESFGQLLVHSIKVMVVYVEKKHTCSSETLVTLLDRLLC